MARPLCRHCRRKPINRSRGLCWRCWHTPGVLELYPSTSKFARRGVGFAQEVAAAPPTTALPGTPEKVSVLEARATAGAPLFAAGDPALPTRPGARRQPVARLAVSDEYRRFLEGLEA